MQQRRAQLIGVVRRDVRRHADGDAGRAVGQQVRERRRQHHRLLAGAVVGRAEIDRVLVDAFEQRLRHLVSAALGVAHGRGVIAVDVAEVALPVDQRVAHGEILREAHQRVVDRLVAVRVVVAHHLADDLGALLVAAGGVELQLAHGVEDAPVHGLQAVAHVGQRAVHDRRQRVGEIALFQRILAAGWARCRRGRAESVCRSWRLAYRAEPSAASPGCGCTGRGLTPP